MAYAALRYEDVDAKTGRGMTAAKLRRIASATQPRGATLDELWVIADACNVPREWLESGKWDDEQGQMEYRPPTFGEGSVENRLGVIENYLRALIALEEARSGGELRLPTALREPRPPTR